jgi:ABC-2 type transport system ATP-binding protein
MTDSAPLLDIRGLHRRIGSQQVLGGIDLRLQRGELLGLIGANGSGKSSLIRCIAGLTAWDAGDIAVAGCPIRQSLAKARLQIGYAVEPALLPDALTGMQCLQLFAAARGLDDIPSATLALAGELRLDGVLPAMIARYSLGMRQKLSLCLALLGEPPLLLLDESLNGLDPLGVYTMKQKLGALVRQEKCAVILATHMLDSTQSCMTRVALLHDGRLLREWRGTEWQSLQRGDGGVTLEQAMVGCLRTASA